MGPARRWWKHCRQLDHPIKEMVSLFNELVVIVKASKLGWGSKRVEDGRGELGPTTYNHSVDDWEVGLVVVVVMIVVVTLKMSFPRVLDLVS